MLVFAPVALAAPPEHPRTPALDGSDLDQACGAAVDPEGYLYAASPGEGKIKVFEPSDHETPVAEIANAHEPCALAADSRGDLFVLESETGEVVRYIPDEYPLAGTPTYSAAEVIDPSGEARGLTIDTGELWTISKQAAGGDDTLFVARDDRVEARSNEAQGVKISGSGGTYELCFEGECTAPLPYNASHEEVQEALEALSAIGKGNVAVTTANFGATDHRVTFIRGLGLTDVPRIEVDTSELSASALTALFTQGGLGTDEEQQVRLSGASGGSFTLTFAGQTTESIPHEPSAGTIKTALEGLSNIEAGDVTVRMPEETSSSRLLSVTFKGAYAATDVPQIEATASLEPNEVQQITVKATAGTYTLSFEGEETGAIPYNAPANEPGTEAVDSVQEYLEALSKIGEGNVSVTGGPGDEAGTSPYLVAFEGKLAGTNVPLLGRDQTLLAGTVGRSTLTSGPTLSVSTVAEGWSGRIGEGTLTQATGLAAYTHPVEGERTDRYLFVADAATDRIEVFAAAKLNGTATLSELVPRPPIEGPAEGEGFEFGSAGAQLAVDPGSALEEKTLKCLPVGEQACTAGHLVLYDAAREEVEEFDAAGHFLDSFSAAGLTDAEPSALAIDRSGGATDGTIYVGSGADPEARLLAFGPLGAPYREAKPELSQTLEGAAAVATDPYGDVYVVAGSTVHIYGTDGEEITSFGVEEPSDKGLAVDSQGRVYVLFVGKGLTNPAEYKVCYYTPSTALPPEAGTTYSGPTCVATGESLESQSTLDAIGVDPSDDRLFVGGHSGEMIVISPPEEGSKVIDPCFACGGMISYPSDIAVGTGGEVYTSGEGRRPAAIDPSGSEFWARVAGAGSLLGLGSLTDPNLAADLSNGHMLVFKIARETAEEYDASGAFVAAFGAFTSLARPAGIAIDNACALHEPPLTGEACEEFDPANGTVYVAFDDTAPESYDVTAFGPLEYPPPEEHTLTVEKTGEGSGTLTSSPAGIDCGSTCSHKFPETETVTLTAKPDEGSVFEGWGAGECEAQTVSPAEGTCELAVAEMDREVTAEFKSIGEGVPLEVIIEGSGKGTVTSKPAGIECPSTCKAVFGELVKVVLTAKAAKGFEINEWGEGECEAQTISPTGSEGTCTVTMTKPQVVVKVTLGVEHPLLAVKRQGTGSGAVTSEPPGIDCGSTCSAKLNLEEEVTLTAVAAAGSLFAGWGEGECEEETVAAGEGTCTATMSGPAQVTATFEALPGVAAESPQPITYTEATLRGEVDPAGSPTTYHFEYLTQAEYEAAGESFAAATSTPVLALEGGKGFVAVQAPLTGLAEGTPYRFRLLAENGVGKAEAPGLAFTTLERPAAQSCPNSAYRTGLSAKLPDCRAYELVTPAETHGARPNTGRYVSAGRGFNQWFSPPRDPGAGERLSYFVDGTLPGFEGNGVLDGYTARRGAGEHPADGWTNALFGPSYLLTGGGSSKVIGVGAAQEYSLLNVGAAEGPVGSLPVGTYLRTPAAFEVLGRGSLGEDLKAEGRFLARGGTHAIFTSTAHLEPEAPSAPVEAIYDRAAGSAVAEVLSVKPGGGPFGGATYLDTSEDGTAVAFGVGEALYLHRGGETVEVAKAPSFFAGLAADGSRLLYSRGGDLYTYDAASAKSEKIVAGASFVSASPDASAVLISQGLDLYYWNGSAPLAFVGTLDPADVELFGFGGEPNVDLAHWRQNVGTGDATFYGRDYSPTRATPGGEVFVFQSHAQLTEYKNEGVGEIYRYAPAAPEGQRLLCVSCDPTGAPPDTDAMLQFFQEPAATLSGFAQIPNLTDDGTRVLFHSADQLLPEDANEAIDVYEWKAPGTVGPGGDTCARPTGCLALISSGQGEAGSYLYSMSADGHDAFLSTTEKLLGADVAGSPSIYDAREGGGIPEAPPAEVCEGDACQGSPAQPPATSPRATTGPGEAAQPSSSRRHCAKGRRLVKGRCVRKAKRRHRRHRRAHHRRHRPNHATRGGTR